MRKFIIVVTFGIALVSFGLAQAADIVPDVIMMPGTQPQEVSLEAPGRCLNCHKDYETNPRVEPGFGWMGAAMGNAGRDPIFWATLAIAEQDFDGAGDLCIRCHSAGGWVGGRSTPTDASGLQASDEHGIDCDTCHQMTNPDYTEHAGVMNPPFIANQEDLPYGPLPEGATEAYYGSGMYALSNDYGKLGPYDQGDAVARHQFTKSNFHRDVDFCGTCHDVSNSAVGQLAPNAGTLNLNSAPGVTRSGHLGYPLQVLFDPNDPNVPNDPAVLGGTEFTNGMAAFENPPYAYGIVERTYSEYKASPLSSLRVFDNSPIPEPDFRSLPPDLQDPRGSLYAAYMAATTQETRSGDYVDGDPRYFSCQTCHMRAITGRGCDKKDAPNRLDQPMHDQTGGNYWVFPLIKYQDAMGTLRLGGGLSTEQIEAIDDGTLRAGQHLTQAATLDVNGDTVRITNMTGHKLISGYPEGRRMWLNIRWFNNGVEMTDQETGAWGKLPIAPIQNPVNTAQTFIPKSIVNLDDPRLKVYEVHPAMTRGWAQTLLAVDDKLIANGNAPVYGPKVLGYDRVTGAPLGTIADLANGTIVGHENADYFKTFHFVLNNYVADDNRIPPYQMSYDEAQIRNALPVPADQYGGAPGGVYEHWDEFNIAQMAPQGATSAELTLYYQGTSWEYVQFLWLANNCTDPTDPNQSTACATFLGLEGVNYLDAWVNAENLIFEFGPGNQTMVPPYPMATATWEGGGGGCVPEICDDGLNNDCDLLTDCDDPDCDGDPACDTLIEWPLCFDGLDNDDDGLTDCEDRTDCDDEPGDTTNCGIGVCATTGFIECKNGAQVDSCTPLPPQENNEVSCFDGLDNDCNAQTDCADANCDGALGAPTTCGVGVCAATGNLTCSGGAEVDTCTPGDPTEPVTELTCDDGLDNDCDGLTDTAEDPDCKQCSDYTNRTDCRNAGCSWKKNMCQ
jgi:hypothetical protein